MEKTKHVSHAALIGGLILALSLVVGLLLASCSAATESPAPGTAVPAATAAQTVAPTPSPASPAGPVSPPTATPSPASPTPTPTPTTSLVRALASYTPEVILRGVGRPDDLAVDNQGGLLFSDEVNGTINRLNGDGSVTLLLSGAAGPEGMYVQPDGSIIYAEQNTNRIMALEEGKVIPVLIRNLPGNHRDAVCAQGVDGLGYDEKTNTLIVPDSPTGEVYRMSLDGTQFDLLASDIMRPVGAAVDNQGNIYVAEECGGAIVIIRADGSIERISGFRMPDDVILDGFGNLLVIDLAASVHALVRLNLATGERQTLLSDGLIEPQGLAIDKQGVIYVADTQANVIVRLTPAQ